MPALSSDARPVRTSRLAIMSTVFGILSLLLLVLASIPGLVCGIMGLSRITTSERATTGPRLRGRGFAITGLVLSGAITLVTPLLVALLLPAVSAARRAAMNQNAVNNLKQLALAMTIAADQGIYPLVILDEDKQPLLSWRVAILPMLGEEKLFEEFHLDEPWDSDHNRKLIPRMPAVFGGSGGGSEVGRTGMVLPAAAGMAFAEGDTLMDLQEGGSSKLLGVRPSAFRDGLSDTVLIVSVPGLDVPWTKPADLGVDAVEVLAAAKAAGFWSVPVVFADASARLIATETPAAEVRGMFSRDGDGLAESGE